MAEIPLLVHLKPPTTTRVVASVVRERGVAGLDEAQRRADQAAYQEVTCRSALNRVKGMPFEWTLNPYRGCTHACHYCYARRYQPQFELNPDDQFSTVILACFTPSTASCLATARVSRLRPGSRLPLSPNLRGRSR